MMKKDGWKIMNIQKNPEVDFIGDLSDLSQFQDESIEEIYTSHVLEHVDQKNALKSLEGVNRVLKTKQDELKDILDKVQKLQDKLDATLIEKESLEAKISEVKSQ